MCPESGGPLQNPHECAEKIYDYYNTLQNRKQKSLAQLILTD